MLESSRAEIRVTVWESDLNKIKNIGIKILYIISKNIYSGEIYNFNMF